MLREHARVVAVSKVQAEDVDVEEISRPSQATALPETLCRLQRSSFALPVVCSDIDSD